MFILEEAGFNMRKWRINIENILTQVWKRWKSNYPLELKSAHQYQQVDWASELKENTVVMIKENTQWLIWKIGIIIQTHPICDGWSRACSVRLQSGAVIRRPVQLLCPLQVSTLSTSDVSRSPEAFAKWKETARRH